MRIFPVQTISREIINNLGQGVILIWLINLVISWLYMWSWVTAKVMLQRNVWENKNEQNLCTKNILKKRKALQWKVKTYWVYLHRRGLSGSWVYPLYWPMPLQHPHIHHPDHPLVAHSPTWNESCMGEVME